jgi:regulator of replication initiation timing
MQINLDQNPAMKDALLGRLKAEFAETCVANFVLDMLAGQLAKEKADLETRVAELVEANTRLNEDCGNLRSELERVTRPERAPRGAVARSELHHVERISGTTHEIKAN